MNYRRKGYPTKEAYDEACREANRIKKLARARSKAKHTTRAVLTEVCTGQYQDFDKVEVTFTKAQISEAIGGVRSITMIRSLRFLREEGTLVPIKNWQGGKGVPTTYRICAVGQGATDEPPAEGQAASVEDADTSPDPVLARMKEIMSERPEIDAIRAYGIAEAEAQRDLPKD